MKRKFTAGLTLTAALISLSMLLAGCGNERNEPEAQPEPLSAAESEIYAESEFYTELYEAETETDMFGEVQLRSIWEIMPDETRIWAASFRAEDVQKILYTTYMEGEPDTYEFTGIQEIASVFEAIDEIQAAGAISMPPSQGDVFVFEMKDGSSVTFSFSLTCIIVDGTAYETDHTDRLWELTGGIMFGEAMTETEY